MVRKTVRALMFVGDGIRDVSWISDMLNPDAHEEGIESAPSHGLVLVDVLYDSPPEWIDDGYSIKRANETIAEVVKKYNVMSSVMKQLMIEDTENVQ